MNKHQIRILCSNKHLFFGINGTLHFWLLVKNNKTENAVDELIKLFQINYKIL